jgi:hypothetical protein
MTMTDETMTLTVLAKASADWPPRSSAPGRVNDGNIALDAIKQRLQAVSASGRHVLEEASTVREVALRVRAAKAEGRRFGVIQIVGHGMPGQLSLGFHWNGVYADERDYYALDSNPRSYGVLRGIVDGGVREVRLLGCAVGASRSGGLATNGPTLLFALGQLWLSKSVAVLGAEGAVAVDDFDDAGEFTGPLVGYDGAPRAETAPPRGALLARGAGLEAQHGEATPRGMSAVVPRGEGARPASVVVQNAPDEIKGAFGQEVRFEDGALPLSTPLCNVVVSLGGQIASAQLLFVDTYYVRVPSFEGVSRYFRLSEGVNTRAVATFVADRWGAIAG